MVTVRDGDTIYALAARYGVPPTSIVTDNQIGPPYSIFAGQQLRITPQRTHVVGPEDTIYSISQRYAVSQYQLAEANGLDVPFELIVGQRLILPASLDFSVLDLRRTPLRRQRPAIPKVVQKPANAPRKRFVAPSGSGAFRWRSKGKSSPNSAPQHAASIMTGKYCRE